MIGQYVCNHCDRKHNDFTTLKAKDQITTIVLGTFLLYLVHSESVVFWVNLQQNFTSYKTFTTIVHHKYFPVIALITEHLSMRQQTCLEEFPSLSVLEHTSPRAIMVLC